MSLRIVKSNPEGVVSSQDAHVIRRKKTPLVAWLKRNNGADWLIWTAIPIATAAALLLGMTGSFTLITLAVGVVALSCLFVIDQRALVAVIIVGVGLLFDYTRVITLPIYFPALATVVAALFLAAWFLAQSSKHPWIRVPHLGWWICLLVLALLPALRGGVAQGGRYYVTVLLNGLLLYMVGVQVARNLPQIRQLFSLLSGFAALIAIHSILQARIGNVLLPTQYWEGYLTSVNYFSLAGRSEIRAGSFFINPDSDSAFLALMFFLPVSLLLESPSWRLKLLYAVEAALILLGIFFTYSLASLGAICAGGILFILLVGRGRYRFYALGLIGALMAGVLIAFPSLLHLLYNRLTTPGQITDRLGAWATGLGVILAHPLTGLGLSFYTYQPGAEPYRHPFQTVPLAHPHNSFLELGALGGLPLLILFLIVFGKAWWSMVRNYRRGEIAQRILLGGGITALTVITINSMVNSSWTLPPLVIVDWLLLGALSSPALIPPLRSRSPQEKRVEGADRKVGKIAPLAGGAQA